MAHFAQLDENNIVVAVYPARDEDTEESLTERTGVTYKQTSYNTSGGIHFTQDENGKITQSADQSKAFRKNFAGIGMTYDADRDAFIGIQPHASWILNEDTCLWEAPIPCPKDGLSYLWDEAQGDWVEIQEPSV